MKISVTLQVFPVVCVPLTLTPTCPLKPSPWFSSATVMSRKNNFFFLNAGNKSENKKQLRWRLFGSKYKKCNVPWGKYKELTIRKVASLKQGVIVVFQKRVYVQSHSSWICSTQTCPFRLLWSRKLNSLLSALWMVPSY